MLLVACADLTVYMSNKRPERAYHVRHGLAFDQRIFGSYKTHFVMLKKKRDIISYSLFFSFSLCSLVERCAGVEQGLSFNQSQMIEQKKMVKANDHQRVVFLRYSFSLYPSHTLVSINIILVK